MGAERKVIYLVDDNMTNLALGKDALEGSYKVFTIPSAEKMLMMIEKLIPDLILLDIEMPEMNGYEAIKILKSNERTASIPVIFLTAKDDAGSELEGLSLGAIDYIVKPFSPPLLLKRVDVHLLVEQQKSELKDYNDNLQEMVKTKTKTVIQLQNAVLKTVAELVEHRDDVTGGHIERTQNYLRIMVDALLESELYGEEASNWDLDFLMQSAQLHDVGKIGIRDNILLKPAKLTDDEFETIKTHTVLGVEIIEQIQENSTEMTFLEYAKIFAGSHHEKWDGSGYPNRLAGKSIPLQGRLMAIADVYDALISERPYKNAFSHEEAVTIISEGSGTHFDPALVDIFIKNADKFKQVAKNSAKGVNTGGE